MQSRLFVLFIGLIFTPVKANQSFSFAHPDCRLRIKKIPKDQDFLKEIFIGKLKERGYKVDYMVDNKRLIVKDIYMNLLLTRPPSTIYKKCKISLELRYAKGNTPTASDPVLYKKSVIRSLPRITFKGNERCTRAMKDAFVHIPHCKKN